MLEVTIPEQYPHLPIQSFAILPPDAKSAKMRSILKNHLTLKELLEQWKGIVELMLLTG
jgi:hypothetical protein